VILPDVGPLPPEPVEFLLWLWWCVTLGLGVNSMQLLLSRATR
jgi:hypothetical protein